MAPILIDRFRSVHERGQVTLTAELSAMPEPDWVELCSGGFDRYFNGFGELPALVGSTIVVATTSRGLAVSQAALQAVVAAANERWRDTD